MKIKVCGMKHPGNIAEVAALQPDYMGFIFYPESPRYIGETEKNLFVAHVVKTGVFVNESADVIEETIERHQLGAIQLHGNESPDLCELFKDKVTVIKAFGVDEHFDFAETEPYVANVDYLLFDTKTSKHGGSGQKFNWQLLDNYKFDTPFFLSGGLDLENLQEIKAINHPRFYGVDLNSRFEVQPGLKDIAKLKKAFAILR